jgi:hypothetical protein
MKTHRMKAVIMRHAYEIRRNVDRVTDMVYWPVLDIIIWGFFTIYLRARRPCRRRDNRLFAGRGHTVGNVLLIPARHGGRLPRRVVVPKPD